MIFGNLKVSNGTVTRRFSGTELIKNFIDGKVIDFSRRNAAGKMLFRPFHADGPDKFAVVEHGNKALVTIDDRQLVNPCPAHL